MENKELLTNMNNEQVFKDFLFNKAKTFLNKKRNLNKEPIKPEDFDEKFFENFENLLTNTKSFKNLNYSKVEQLSIFPKSQNDLTNETTLNKKETDIPKESSTSEIVNKSINNTYDSLMSSQPEEKLFSNENILEEKDDNITSQEAEKIIKLEEIEENSTKNIKSNNKEKDNLCCLALDLLNKYGEFQIKFSKTCDSKYILKIKEVEIKDNYFEQMEYAKNYGKYSNLKYTAPNNKFWLQRYYYFSKFDKGIMMDNESWYSVTPEEIAKYTAKLIKGKSIIDGFCGCGGNVIQFSKYCSKVYAIDISKKKLELCRNNCKVYNCKDNILFIHSDFLEMKNKIKADYIFLSPPWGGTEYKSSEIYSIKKYMHPDITEIVRVSMNVADNILFFLPRNLDLDELFDICSKVKNEIKENSGKNIFFDIQIIKSNNRIKSLLIIFGHHIKDYFNKQKLEKFLKTQYYKNINENNINKLFDVIKKIGCYLFFKEEYNFRTKNKNINNIVDLYEYIKNFSNNN